MQDTLLELAAKAGLRGQLEPLISKGHLIQAATRVREEGVGIAQEISTSKRPVAFDAIITEATGDDEAWLKALQDLYQKFPAECRMAAAQAVT